MGLDLFLYKIKKTDLRRCKSVFINLNDKDSAKQKFDDKMVDIEELDRIIADFDDYKNEIYYMDIINSAIEELEVDKATLGYYYDLKTFEKLRENDTIESPEDLAGHWELVSKVIHQLNKNLKTEYNADNLNCKFIIINEASQFIFDILNKIINEFDIKKNELEPEYLYTTDSLNSDEDYVFEIWF